MRFSLFSTLAVLTATAFAQNATNSSICDRYTTALLKNNTAANQYTLLTLVVNTAVIGNYTKPNVGIKVPGILASNATYMGQSVNLVPYFSGGLQSTNEGGPMGVSVNFLDGGGAVPLMNNSPATNTSSNQYTLLTHLYSYFGALLGCSAYNTTGFPAYAGQASQFNVHKYMVLDQYEVGYFIQQVGLAAASFGVSDADVADVASALDSTFNKRCSAAATVIPAQGPQLQEICAAETCSFGPSESTNCSAYPSPVPAPLSAGVMASSSAASSARPSSSAASSRASSASSGSHSSAASSVPARR